MKIRQALHIALVASTFLALGCGAEGEPEEIDAIEGGLQFDNQPGTTSPYFYDGGSMSGDTHVCPLWTVMVGAQLSKGIYKCARLSGPNGGITGTIDYPSQYWETSYQKNGMLSCKDGYVMTGYNPGSGAWRNPHLLCVRPTIFTGFSYVDYGTQDSYPMHVCREDPTNPYKYAIQGIHASTNRFTCAR